jgi:ABC-type multidrug transport system fused ATPase/permease subunit
VLCIAHRLHTIAYYDLVMVMDKGQVVEFADPFTLMTTDGSLFRGLCQSTGDFDELLSTAKAVAT